MLYWWFRRDTSRSGARWIDGNMIEMAVVRELRTATAFQEGVFTTPAGSTNESWQYARLVW
jgi:hypothetical protein